MPHGGEVIEDSRAGIRVRLADKWIIHPDPMPAAYSAVMCPHCLQGFSGTGTSLQESTNAAEKAMAQHECPGFYRMTSL